VLTKRNYNTANVAPTVKMFIDGQFVESKATEWIDLPDPATNEIVTRVPKCTQDEMNAAVESSKRAFKTWSQTSVLTRQQVMFKLQQIIRANMSELAKNITKEQGKTLVDAEGDVLRGLRESK
jgi:malonate-semialdehyde dehydrogenase (acetylating)/methylmalonate-semialdehyde dehydrogenase